MPTRSAPGRLTHIVSTKFDGSPHKRYDARLIEPYEADTGGPMRLYTPAGTHVSVGAAVEGMFTVACTSLFWPGSDCWWNLEHYHAAAPHPRRGLVLSYANVSLPARLDGDTLHWVDLDLDVILTTAGAMLEDENEFEAHTTRLAYPPDLVRRAREAAATLVALAATGAPPFDRATYV